MVAITNNPVLKPLLAGDHKASSGLIKDLLAAKVPPAEIYESLLKPAMYQIGELWEENKISVATEHMASAIVESLLNEIYLSLKFAKKSNKKVIVTCLENEHHQIGARMVSDVFELKGWDVLFLGANTPTKDLLKYIQETSPMIVCISLSIYFNLPILQLMLDDITDQFPDLTVLTGGQAFTRGGRECILKYKNVHYLSDLPSLEIYLNATN